MKKALTELLKSEEYIDDDLKAVLKKVNDAGEVDAAQLLSFMVHEHKDVINQLHDGHITRTYEHMRELVGFNKWRSLLYIGDYAIRNAKEILEKNSDCKLSAIMLESLKLNKAFGELGIDDRKRMFELYENDFGERDA